MHYYNEKIAKNKRASQALLYYLTKFNRSYGAFAVNTLCHCAFVLFILVRTSCGTNVECINMYLLYYSRLSIKRHKSKRCFLSTPRLGLARPLFRESSYAQKPRNNHKIIDKNHCIFFLFYLFICGYPGHVLIK